MINHQEELDALSWKMHNTRSGCDPPSIVPTPLALPSKFGVSLTIGSGLIAEIQIQTQKIFRHYTLLLL